MSIAAERPLATDITTIFHVTELLMPTRQADPRAEIRRVVR